MSLNAWGGALHDALTAYLPEVRPDILCLQEVSHSPDTNQRWLTYRDGTHILPQRANLLTDVMACLPEHMAIYCPASRGILWDGETPIPSQFGLATFIHRSIPLVSQVQGFVHGSFSPDSFGAHPRGRNAHALRVYDDRSRRAVSVVQMHGLRDLRGKMDTPERDAQARRLSAIVQSIAEPGDPIIVCGDFNVEPGSRTFDILAEIGLRDLVTTGGWPGTRTSHYKKPGRFADYLLVNDQVGVKQFQVVAAPEVSDHCPLLLDI